MSVSSALLPSDCWEVDVCVDGTSHRFIFQHTRLCSRALTVRRQPSRVELLLAGGLFSIFVNMEFYYLRK